MYFFKNLIIFYRAWSIQTKCILMMTKEGSTKIVNFMTGGIGVLVPRCGHLSYIVKMHNFFKNILLYTQAQITQTEGIVFNLMSREGSTKIVNVMTPRIGILVLGRCHISHSENALFSLRIFSSLRHRSNKLRV